VNWRDALNAAVKDVPSLPRVRFDVGWNDASDNWILRKHVNGAVHEPATIAAFLAVSRARPVSAVYDVGALFGYFSLVAQQLFMGSKVVAFEMHGGVITPLMRNVPNLFCVHAAASDETRLKVKCWVSGFNLYEEPEGGWDRLADIPGAMKERGEGNRGRFFREIDFVTIDDCIAEYGLPAPDLIKIDVEGYQAKALRGAMGTIRARKPIIIIELHDPEKIARFGTTNKDTVQPLFDLGYHAFWCGNFRDKDASFEAVSEMRPEHERLSIMVFVP